MVEVWKKRPARRFKSTRYAYPYPTEQPEEGRVHLQELLSLTDVSIIADPMRFNFIPHRSEKTR